MIAGHLREINGFYYMVFHYKDKQGKRRNPTKATGLHVKGNKKKAELMLLQMRMELESQIAEEEQQNEMGKLINPDYLSRFSKFLENHGLRPIRFHDLRHSCASLLLANGVNLKDIQAWLGHSTINTTANIYVHQEFASKITSANAILAILPDMSEKTEENSGDLAV